MHTPQQQRIFETLRNRFGIAGKEGFDAPIGAQRPSAFPDAILKTGLHECLGQGPGDWASVLGFALSAGGCSGQSIFILSLKSSTQELGELYGHGFAGFGLDAANVIIYTQVCGPEEREIAQKLWSTF